MNEHNTPWFPIALRYGLLTGLASAVFIAINFMAGTFSYIWLGLIVALAISVGGIVLAHREYKRNNGSYMKYGKGLLIGTVVSIIASLIGGVVSYVYLEYVDPGILDTMKEMQVSMMEGFGMADDQLETAIDKINEETTSVNQLKNSFWNGLIGGFILSLIVSAFTKKNEPEFE